MYMYVNLKVYMYICIYTSISIYCTLHGRIKGTANTVISLCTVQSSGGQYSTAVEIAQVASDTTLREEPASTIISLSTVGSCSASCLTLGVGLGTTIQHMALPHAVSVSCLMIDYTHSTSHAKTSMLVYIL